MKAKNKKTGETVSVLYAKNRLGNMRMWVDGKFYADKVFDRKFQLIEEKVNELLTQPTP